MQPLREREDARSVLEAEAIALLRSQQPYEAPPGLKQRVRARLLAPGGARRRALRFRAPLVWAALLGAAGASAAAGKGWLGEGLQALLAPKTESAAPRPAPTAHGARPSGKPVEPAPTVRAAEPAEVAAAPLLAEPAAAATTVGPGSTAKRAPARHGSAPAEGANLVFGAMRALRKEGQPGRALKLLEEYLRRYPNGALAEEAMALSVEAAAARGDGRAKELANRYLTRYPSGQFRGSAERARALDTP